MGRISLRSLVATLVRDLNILIVGATVEELHDIMAVLAATQAHVTVQLLTASDQAQRVPGYMKAADVAELTGYSRAWLYENGMRLGIARHPKGARGLRFPRAAVTRWMEDRSG